MNLEEEQKHRWSQCGGCGGEKRWLLHNVRHRAAYRRLCTNCILKTHQGLFCPFCFHVYDHDSLLPAASDRLMCLKCPSISHLSCVPTRNNSSSSFICPACSTPNFSFFKLPPDNNFDVVSIDIDSARALVAAAKIAAVSMTKAAALARVEAESRIKEAILAKKRAREALETLSSFSSQDNTHNNNQLTKRILPDGIVKDQSRKANANVASPPSFKRQVK